MITKKWRKATRATGFLYRQGFDYGANLFLEEREILSVFALRELFALQTAIVWRKCAAQKPVVRNLVKNLFLKLKTGG